MSQEKPFSERQLGRPVKNHIKWSVDREFDLRDRIHELLDKFGYTQSDVAKKLGKQRSLVHRWLKGGQSLTLKTISAFEELFQQQLLTVPAYAISKNLTITRSPRMIINYVAVSSSIWQNPGNIPDTAETSNYSKPTFIAHNIKYKFRIQS